MGKVGNSVLMVFAVFAGGFLGGMFSDWYFENLKTDKSDEVARFDVIEAKKVKIIDSNGNQRAVLGEGKGDVGLLFFDKRGKTRISLGWRENGVGLVLHDQKENSRVFLGFGDQEVSGLRFSDSKNTTRILLAHHSEEYEGLGLFDKNGNVRLELEYLENEQNGLLLYDGMKEKPSVKLLSMEKGNKGLQITDQEERERISIGVNNLGNPLIGMTDIYGKVRVGIIQVNDKTEMWIRDKDEKIFWQAKGS